MRNTFLNVVIIITTYFFTTSAYSNNFNLKLDEILNSNHRSQINKDRDKFRNPKQTLEFFGLRSDSNVMEITPGRGWYTEILAPVVKDNGIFSAVIYQINDNSKAYFKKLDKFYRSKLKQRPDMYENVKIIAIDPAQSSLLFPLSTIRSGLVQIIFLSKFFSNNFL